MAPFAPPRTLARRYTHAHAIVHTRRVCVCGGGGGRAGATTKKLWASDLLRWESTCG